MGNRGKREFIQVLRLLEAIPQEIVTFAVTEAIRLGAIGFDAVKQIALARIERRPARLDLTAYPHLPQTGVKTTSAADYAVLSRESGMTGNRLDAMPTGTTSGTPQVLLGHHLKQLKLPTVLREYDKVARECARDGVDHPRYLLRLVELELIDRERRAVERRIRAARFPAVKSLDTFDFTAIPSLNKMLVLELARCEYILRRENVIALGNSGTGKTHVALALGLAACQKGFPVALHHRGGAGHQLMEARDERRLLKLQRELQAVKLLIIDELGYVPLSQTGAELLFEVFSQRYERGSTIVTSNLPFEDWTPVLGSERLTGALLDRLTHHVHILTMNGDSYRLKQSAGRRRAATSPNGRSKTRPSPKQTIKSMPLQSIQESSEPQPPDQIPPAARSLRRYRKARFASGLHRARTGLLLLRRSGLDSDRR